MPTNHALTEDNAPTEDKRTPAPEVPAARTLAAMQRRLDALCLAHEARLYARFQQTLKELPAAEELDALGHLQTRAVFASVTAAVRCLPRAGTRRSLLEEYQAGTTRMGRAIRRNELLLMRLVYRGCQQRGELPPAAFDARLCP